MRLLGMQELPYKTNDHSEAEFSPWHLEVNACLLLSQKGDVVLARLYFCISFHGFNRFHHSSTHH